MRDGAECDTTAAAPRPKAIFRQRQSSSQIRNRASKRCSLAAARPPWALPAPALRPVLQQLGGRVAGIFAGSRYKAEGQLYRRLADHLAGQQVLRNRIN